MASQTFNPVDTFDPTKERDWAPNLGMLDWDSTNIVFTKRSLIEFLKYTGTTVDTNFSNISKLPKYAKFGKISSDPPATAKDVGPNAEVSATPSDEESAFRPSRRVRTDPGGPSTDIFEEEFGDDALSQAPSKTTAAPDPPVTAALPKEAATEVPSWASGVRPSRRVRTAPGGKDSLAGGGLFGSPEDDETEFKPTRRIRQGPGGQDSVGSLLG